MSGGVKAVEQIIILLFEYIHTSRSVFNNLFNLSNKHTISITLTENKMLPAVKQAHYITENKMLPASIIIIRHSLKYTYTGQRLNLDGTH